MKILEIEDTSDCELCQQRDKDDWELLQSVKIKTIGETWCYECGREYMVLTEEEKIDHESDGS